MNNCFVIRGIFSALGENSDTVSLGDVDLTVFSVPFSFQVHFLLLTLFNEFEDGIDSPPLIEIRTSHISSPNRKKLC